MKDRGRYDSSMFWLAFGTAAAVIGLALMTIGVTRSSPGADLLGSGWFDAGLAVLGVGALLLLWALVLYLGRRRDSGGPLESASSTSAPSTVSKEARDLEVIRGYFGERDKLFRMWQQRQKGQKDRKDRP